MFNAHRDGAAPEEPEDSSTAGPAASRPLSASAGVGPDAREERDWATRLAAGDADAFEAIYRKYYRRLCSYANQLIHSGDVAAEIVADVFTQLWQRRLGWRLDGSLKNYLYVAVRNRVGHYLDHRRVVERTERNAVATSASPGMGGPPVSPEDELYVRELADLAQRVLVSLPDRCREAVVLQHQHGLTYAEIAQVMRISPSTVKKHLIRAGQAFRDALAAVTEEQGATRP